MIRLFVGISLPPEVRRYLLSRQTGIRGGRWQRDDQLHLTLKFIGEVDETTADDIDAALSSIAAPAFPITVDGAGVFGPPTAPRMLWAGVTPKDSLIHLHDKIEAALGQIGVAPEERKFTPHITLARLSNGRAGAAGVAAFLEAYGGLKTPSFMVKEFLLYSSKMGENGSFYTVEARYPLR